MNNCLNKRQSNLRQLGQEISYTELLLLEYIQQKPEECVLSDSSKKHDCQRQYMAFVLTEADYGKSTLFPIGSVTSLALCLSTMQYMF